MLSLALSAGRAYTPEAVLFWVLAPLSFLAGIGMIFAKKAVHSALFLAFIMVSLAFFYIAEGALFLGIVQVVVYTGAVMMLFLFILMLVGVDSSDSLIETIRGQRIASIVMGVGLGVLFLTVIGRASVGHPALGLDVANSNGNVQGIANLLFSQYVWAFEVVSALLITAALGAMVLAHSKKTAPSQRAQAIARFRGPSMATAAGLPGSGVFARHNAVDVPALLPDGSASQASISRTLKARGEMLPPDAFELKVEEEEK